MYTLTQDVNAPGTCFNITASNVELDCAGYNIIYGTGTGSNSSGINVSVTTAQTNVTIKNCKIIKGRPVKRGKISSIRILLVD